MITQLDQIRFVFFRNYQMLILALVIRGWPVHDSVFFWILAHGKFGVGKEDQTPCTLIVFTQVFQSNAQLLTLLLLHFKRNHFFIFFAIYFVLGYVKPKILILKPFTNVLYEYVKNK